MDVIDGGRNVAGDGTFVNRERRGYSKLQDRQKGKGGRSDSVVLSKGRTRRGIGQSHWGQTKIARRGQRLERGGRKKEDGDKRDLWCGQANCQR